MFEEQTNKLNNTMRFIKSRTYQEVTPVNIQNLYRKIGASDRIVQISPLETEEVYLKAQRIFNGSDEKLTRKEYRYLISTYGLAKNNLDMARFILSMIDLNNRSTFRKAALIYLLEYDGKNSAMEMLRMHLMQQIKNDDSKRDSFPSLRITMDILAKDGPYRISSYLSKGISEGLNKLLLPDMTFSSRYIEESIKALFKNEKIGLEDKMCCLDEIYRGKLYHLLIPSIAENIILLVDKSRNTTYQENLVQILYKEMGDPRNDIGNRWYSVSDKAKEKYLLWLKYSDLELFFDIIRASANDPKWKYRQMFWEKYLYHMYYTRVVLGQEAAFLADEYSSNKILDYARLTKSDKKKSLFIFSIGDYTFSEASHSGKLRIWKNGDCPIPFYDEYNTHKEYSYKQVIDSNPIEEFGHWSSETNAWQNKVDTWIQLNCHVFL